MQNSGDIKPNKTLKRLMNSNSDIGEKELVMVSSSSDGGWVDPHSSSFGNLTRPMKLEYKPPELNKVVEEMQGTGSSIMSPTEGKRLGSLGDNSVSSFSSNDADNRHMLIN